MVVIKNMIEGGIYFMLPIYIMWITVLILAVRFILLYRSKEDSPKMKRTNDSILFLGSFAFLLGDFGQMSGLYQASGAIQKAGDISPAIIAGGYKVSLLAPLYGFALLLVSAIIWFIFRYLLLSKKQ